MRRTSIALKSIGKLSSCRNMSTTTSYTKWREIYQVRNLHSEKISAQILERVLSKGSLNSRFQHNKGIVNSCDSSYDWPHDNKKVFGKCSLFHKYRQCPTCFKCKRTNHFSKICKSIREVGTCSEFMISLNI